MNGHGEGVIFEPLNRSGRLLVLELPLPQNIANARQHWRVKLKAKKTYWDQLTLLYQAKHLPRMEGPIQKAEIKAHAIVGGQMDTDNLMARFKWTLDWLVKMEYITDDGPDVLHWQEMPTQSTQRGATPVVRLMIQEIV